MRGCRSCGSRRRAESGLGGIGSDTYSYDGRHSFSELKMQAAPYATGATVVVTGPAGTFTASNRWDGGATAKLDVPEGATTWRVTVTSADGNETKTYRVTVRRGEGGGGPAADVRLKTLTVTPVDGTALSFTPGFHLDTEATTFRVRVSSGTTAVTVSVEKNAPDSGRAPDAHRDGPAGFYRRGPGPGRRSVRPRDGQVRPRVGQAESLQVDLGHWPERESRRAYRLRSEGVPALDYQSRRVHGDRGRAADGSLREPAVVP